MPSHSTPSLPLRSDAITVDPSSAKTSSSFIVHRPDATLSDLLQQLLLLFFVGGDRLEIEGLGDTIPAAYSNLRSWTLVSPDMYKVELIEVLYLVLIHCFMFLVDDDVEEAGILFRKFQEDHVMMHSQDLKKLEGVLSPMDLEEVEFVHSLRRSKANDSYDHLFQHLRKRESIMMLELINKHINFQVAIDSFSMTALLNF
ncbi:hypothetical protein Vadar_027879 [Vaccinium darrowii]|uniref:Uncharacterized protein n=1 Tax=Vaccinium darrowii TaxID=229202 RepID=A0ACB7Y9E1_9ERIC|nr:hypothetical protein Vadar_027879 [Vaccinium darrowii]